jgi:hypothetical protein
MGSTKAVGNGYLQYSASRGKYEGSGKSPFLIYEQWGTVQRETFCVSGNTLYEHHTVREYLIFGRRDEVYARPKKEWRCLKSSIQY